MVKIINFVTYILQLKVNLLKILNVNETSVTKSYNKNPEICKLKHYPETRENRKYFELVENANTTFLNL